MHYKRIEVRLTEPQAELLEMLAARAWLTRVQFASMALRLGSAMLAELLRIDTEGLPVEEVMAVKPNEEI